MKRPIFIETGITPQLLYLNNSGITNNALSELVKLYKVSTHARLTLDSDRVPDMVKNKQRAIINDDWLLAYYPNSNTSADWILVNLKTKRWRECIHRIV